MHRRTKTSRRAAIGVTAASLVFAFAGVAAAEPPPPRIWDLNLNLYGWIPATDLEVDGTIGDSAFSRNYDKGLGEAFDDLDGGAGMDMAFRLHRFVTMWDGAWVQSDENSDGWFTNTIVDGRIGVRVLDLNPPVSSASADDGERRVTLDLLGGARYRRAETNVDGDSRFGVRRWHDDREWVDPTVGMAFSVELVPNLSLSTVADIGGFDIGNSSHLTWSVNPRLSYRAFEHLNLFVGWKYLQEDHDDDIEMMLNGPQAGIGYVF